MICTHTLTNLKSLYTLYKTNMLLLCYIILFVPESFMTFSMLCNHVTYDSDICDHHVIGVMHLSHFVIYITIICNITLYSLSKSKIKMRKVNKWSLLS